MTNHETPNNPPHSSRTKFFELILGVCIAGIDGKRFAVGLDGQLFVAVCRIDLPEAVERVPAVCVELGVEPEDRDCGLPLSIPE